MKKKSLLVYCTMSFVLCSVYFKNKGVNSTLLENKNEDEGKDVRVRVKVWKTSTTVICHVQKFHLSIFMISCKIFGNSVYGKIFRPFLTNMILDG